VRPRASRLRASTRARSTSPLDRPCVGGVGPARLLARAQGRGRPSIGGSVKAFARTPPGSRDPGSRSPPIGASADG
jgi:hypothetical protein